MNKNTFDWALVPSFLAALEQGSLLGAARVTGVSQPTLGRHIAELEQQLGLVLFERTGRGLQATPQALGLADAAREMQAGAASFSRLASGAGQAVQGRVRISATQPMACVLLPPVLARMRQALPQVEVELVVSNAVSNLLLREADIALRMVAPEQGSLVARRIGQVRVQACAHADYLGRHGVPQQPLDLLEHDLITGDKDRSVEAGFAAMGQAAEKLRFGLRSDDLLAQWAAIRAGLGIGFVNTHLVGTDPKVQTVLPDLPLPVFPLWLVVHRELHTSARIRAVYDFLAQQVMQMLQAPEDDRR